MLEVLDFLVDTVGLGGFLILASIAALILGGGRKRRVLGILLLIAAMPVSSRIAALPLDASTVEADAVGSPISGDAVVVYGGGVFADPVGGMWPSERSLERAAVGLAFSQQHSLPLAVSGGVVRPDLAAEAQVLADVMQLPEETVLETRARTTAENAEFIAAIAAEKGWRRIILVTSRYHTRRALAASRTAGLEVAAVVAASAERPFGPRDLLPGTDGLARWSVVVHEYVGMLWYMLSGRIDPSSLPL